jgi:hypothetical protein
VTTAERFRNNSLRKRNLRVVALVVTSGAGLLNLENEAKKLHAAGIELRQGVGRKNNPYNARNLIAPRETHKSKR